MHVLVVDDDPTSRTFVRCVLTAKGFEVDEADDAMAALAAIDRRRPDVIVLDIMMPAMSGFELLDRVKASPRLASIPVIMLTAKAEDDDLIASYRSGADYYITKPLVPDQLLYGIGLVLGRELARPAGQPSRSRAPRRLR